MPDVIASSRPALGVSCLVTSDEHILLTKRGNEPAKGFWSLPGGKLEWGETLEAGAAREVLEETGLLIKVPQFVEFAEIIRDEYHYVIAVFIARLAEKAAPTAGDDASDAGWFTFSQMEKMDHSNQMTQGTFKRICRLTMP